MTRIQTAAPPQRDEAALGAALRDLRRRWLLVRTADGIGAVDAAEGRNPGVEAQQVIAEARPITPERLGDQGFMRAHGVRLACVAGSMANGIASEELVIALGRQGLLASFGAAGLVPSRIEAAIERIQCALPDRPYAFNLIHSPGEEALERRAVELYLARGVRTVEASAFLDLTPHIVHYRLAGLRALPDGGVACCNRVMAKVSRREVAARFLSQAPARLVDALVTQRLVTAEQAQLASRVPMCDDLTVEADSGGHTDNRPLVGLLPSLLALRDELQQKHHFATPVRVGAAGGIGTPAATVAAFAMGAAYVVTGSVNQSCVEAGTSPHSKALLAEAGMADVMMAPAADMFEMGVKVQLLKRGTLFPLRAQRLYDLYKEYDSLADIPASEREAVFSLFYRSRAEGTRQSVSGMGLGLYISKEIVVRHGGRIWVESEPGKGSTFYIALPREPKLSEGAAVPAVPPALAG